MENKKKLNPFLIAFVVLAVLLFMVYGSYRHTKEARYQTSSEINAQTQVEVKPEVRTPSTESPISTQDKAAIANATNFEKCKAVVRNTVDSVSSNYKTAKILDNNLMYMVRMCTNDGSVLATCSAPDGNVSPITKVSPDCPL